MPVSRTPTRLAPDDSLRPRARPAGLSAASEAPEVIEAATETAKLPLDRTVLIGIFRRSDRPVAMLRDAEGRIATLTIGDRLGAMTLAGIAGDRVYFRLLDRIASLALPAA